MQLTARNATLSDLAALLEDQHARKVDVVAPAQAITSDDGTIYVAGTDAQIDWDGVHVTTGAYLPTAHADGQIAEKLGIPVAYLRRLRAERTDLYDANVNGWLHGTTATHDPDGQPALPNPDPRSLLLRAFRGDEGVGVLRGVLSDTYKIIDNLDVLTAALDGIRQAGVHVDFAGCDLTERRMIVKIKAPGVAAYAPDLLRGYRSPHSGATAEENPLVFAGLVLSNSEVGAGAFTLTPRIIVQVCNNGLTLTKDAMRSVHLGGKLDEGVIRWSADTQTKQLDLVTAQARDAVATFLDVEYVRRQIAEIEWRAVRPLTDPAAAVTHVGRTLRYTQERIDGVLDHFIRGGQVTAGGIMQAVTSYAQTLPDADDALDMEADGLRALEVAAAL